MNRRTPLLAAVPLTGALALLGCLKADPAHCVNLDGDASCGGATPFCSRCEGDNNGCVTQAPTQMQCLPAGGSSGSTTDTEPTTTSGSTGPDVDCEGPGLDAACPPEQPFCVDNACVGCSADDSLCGGAFEERSICLADPDLCVACLTDSECEQGLGCSGSYSCEGCTEHDQCASGACNLFSGECLPNDPATIFHVSNLNQPCTSGNGSDDSPLCTIIEALEAPVEGDTRIVIVQGTTIPYEDPLSVSSGQTVAFIGRSSPTIEGPDYGIRSVGPGGTRVFVAGFVVRQSSNHGVACLSAGRLWVDDCVIRTNRDGLLGQDCSRLVVRRSRIHSNSDDGVVLTQGGAFEMYASAVTNNGSSTGDSRGFRAGATAFTIVASTIAGNVSRGTFESGPAPTNFLCTAQPGGTVRNSIVAGQTGDTINCGFAAFNHSVIDTDVPNAPDDVIVLEQDGAPEFDPQWFSDLEEGAVTLLMPDSTPFGDVAQWDLGDPRYDVDNVVRMPLPGDAEFAGADQP